MIAQPAENGAANGDDEIGTRGFGKRPDIWQGNDDNTSVAQDLQVRGFRPVPWPYRADARPPARRPVDRRFTSH